jgi:hypothetical protein
MNNISKYIDLVNNITKLNEESERKYNFAGTCVNSFNEDGDSLLDEYRDVSDFAVGCEEAEQISQEKFIQMINVDSNAQQRIDIPNIQYLYDRDHDVVMLYDENEDIHYFYI